MILGESNPNAIILCAPSTPTLYGNLCFDKCLYTAHLVDVTIAASLVVLYIAFEHLDIQIPLLFAFLFVDYRYDRLVQDLKCVPPLVWDDVFDFKRNIFRFAINTFATKFQAGIRAPHTLPVPPVGIPRR